MKPRILILRAPGINRDTDAATACELAGAVPELAHVNRLAERSLRLADYAMVLVPGGFSYGDHLGAGRLLAVDLLHRLGEELHRFIEDGRPVLGICNGFQVLVKTGLLPGWAPDQPPDDPRRSDLPPRQPRLTLAENESRRFECRWVRLAADAESPCIFTRGLERSIEVPVAHGEGRLVVADSNAAEGLQVGRQIALRYVTADGTPVNYPANPNGSFGHAAGICNPQGTVLGLMPHPENAVFPQQHPRWTREPARAEGDGLVIFRNAVSYIATL